MSDNYSPIAGESYKKRVVRLAKLLHVRLIFTFSHGYWQCYFFDSDIGGFHYGPGHP